MAKIKKIGENLNQNSISKGDSLEFLPLAVCDLSPNGIVLSVNSEFERLAGYSLVDFEGKHFSEFFYQKAKVKEFLEQAKGENYFRNKELLLIEKNKNRTPVSVCFLSKKDLQGSFTGHFISLVDISELKELQSTTEKKINQRTEDLQKSRRALLNILEDTELAKVEAETEENKASTIFDNFFDGLIILNSEYQIELINPSAEKFLGIKEADYLGKDPSVMANKKELKEFAKTISKKDKEIYRKEVGESEEPVVLEITTKFIIKEEKRIVTLIILHDISREKVVERLKSQFVSVAAHQLRTPLSIIKWSLCMLLDGEIGLLTNEQIEMLDKAQQTNERMIHLINDLLNVARIEEGRFMYQPKTVDMIELLEKIIEPIQALAKNKRVKFEFKKPTDKTSKVIKADIEKLSLAIKNLLENAIFYTSPGGKVILSAGRINNDVLVSVKDSGIGIPKDQQKRVFNKFFRGDNAVRMETEGTGLGLFITKNIIEAHEGKISFESEEGKGTTFKFSLPAIG
ncbi:PAS domain-containing protein [Patescibacteria group bacterium]|nr:PAS domain-containing protein [Patescibacteria group bacterium]